MKIGQRKRSYVSKKYNKNRTRNINGGSRYRRYGKTGGAGVISFMDRQLFKVENAMRKKIVREDNKGNKYEFVEKNSNTFINNLFNGEGKITMANGHVYKSKPKEGKFMNDGKFIDSMLNGYGKATYATGDVYKGEWSDGKMHGNGKMTYKTGEVYEGEWKDGKSNGYGKMTYKNGDVYEGDWNDGMRQGNGKTTHPNGNVYEYLWVLDEAQESKGRGKITYYKGYDRDHYNHKRGAYDGVYEGELHNGKRDGKGKFTWPSGEIYDGDWVDDYGCSHHWWRLDKHERVYPCGKGIATMKYANGEIYEGEWKNGEKHGKCKMTYKNGDIYDGDWKIDMKDGKGKMTYANGNVYEGQWKCNMKDGKARITTNGNITDEYYVTGQIITQEEYMSGNRTGKRVYTQCDTVEENDEMRYLYGVTIGMTTGIYEGDFVNHKRDGKGKMTYDGLNDIDVGDVYEGEWKEGKKHGKGKMTYTLPYFIKVIDGKKEKFYKFNYKTYKPSNSYDTGDLEREGKYPLEREGEWKDGKPFGEGKFTYANGNIIITEDYYIGKIIYPNGDVYEGKLQKGKRHGEGKMTYVNGNVYECVWKDDKKHGTGKESIYKNGTICRQREMDWNLDDYIRSYEWTTRGLNEVVSKKHRDDKSAKYNEAFALFKQNLSDNYEMVDNILIEKIYKLWEDTYNVVCNKHLKVCNDDGDICACAEIDFNVVDKQAKDLADKAVKQMIDTLPKKK